MKNKHIARIYSGNGCEHLCIITSDGILYTCGYNAKGQLGIGNIMNQSIPRPVESLYGKRVMNVACSYFHSVCVTEGNEVFAWGRGGIYYCHKYITDIFIFMAVIYIYFIYRLWPVRYFRM